MSLPVLFGFVAILVATFMLEDGRNGVLLRPFALLLSAVAGYLGWRWRWLLEGRELEVIAAVGFYACALGPYLSWLWFGREGAVRRWCGRMVLTLLLVVMTVFLCGAVWGLSRSKLLLAGFVGGASLLPWQRFLRWGQRWWSGRQQRREERARAEELQREQVQQREQADQQRELLGRVIQELRE